MTGAAWVIVRKRGFLVLKLARSQTFDVLSSTMPKSRAMGAIAIAVSLAACGGARIVAMRASCENAIHVESAGSCDELSRSATVASEQVRYRLLGARARMWACSDVRAKVCQEALETLWQESEDPQELTTVVALSQQSCLDGEEDGCIRAWMAPWFGRGTALDPAAAMAWHRKLGTVPWSPSLEKEHPSWPKLGAEARIDRARALVMLGAHVSASTLLAAEWDHGLLAGSETRARDALIGTLEARWYKEVEPRIKSDPYEALAAADRLIALARNFPDLAQRRDKIRADMAAAAVTEMTEAKDAALPLSAWFHGARAAQLDRSVAVPKVDVVALWAKLPSRVAFTVPASCEWMRPALTAAYPANRADLPVTVTLSCASSEKTSPFVDEAYSWDETITERKTNVTAGEEYASTSNVSCTGYGVKNGDLCGQVTTVSHAPDHVEHYTETRIVTHRDTRSIRRRTLAVSVTGSIVSAYGTVPVTFTRVLEEAEYTTPHESSSFTSATLADVRRAGAEAVMAAAAKVSASVREQEAAKEMELAADADSEAAEEHLLRAVTLGDPGERLARSYSLPISIEKLLAGEPLVLPSATSPEDTLLAALPEVQKISVGYELSHYPPKPEISAGPEKPSALTVLTRGTEIVLDTGNRTLSPMTGDDVSSTRYGVQVERGWNLSSRKYEKLALGYAPGFVLGGGSNGELGGYFEGRLGGSAGLRGSGVQLLLVGGLGYSSIGVRDAMGTATQKADLDLFYGGDVRLGLDEGLSFDGRLWSSQGGPMGAERRYAAQLLYRRESGAELGIEISIRGYTDQHETMTGLGLVLRTAD